METKPTPKIHPLSILGVLLVAGALVGMTWIIFSMAVRQAARIEATPQYNVTVIPAPTLTNTVSAPTNPATPTAEAPVILPDGAIGINVYVKVTGTEGLGLRMRAAAGTGADINFLAMDDEVFKVVGGPEVSGGYTWWQLEAPLDEKRSGWAAEDFLLVFNVVTPMP